MHQSFTGASRKHRQVNLSGRSSANPWADSPARHQTLQVSASTYNTLANAQAGRVQRQHDRQRVNAARKLQKTWRSHASRRRTKQKWREEWDSVEDSQPDEVTVEAYDRTEVLLAQLRLLVMFFDIRERQDWRRLLVFGKRLFLALQDTDLTQVVQHVYSFQHNLTSLGTRTALLLQYIFSQPQSSWPTDHALARYFGIIHLIGLPEVVPSSMNRNAHNYFTAFSKYLATQHGNLRPAVYQSSLDVMTQLLSSAKPPQYVALVKDLLSSDGLLRIPDTLDQLSQHIHFESLCRALDTILEEKDENRTDEQTVWWLAYFVYLDEQNPALSHSHLKIRILAGLLSRCTNCIAETLSNDFDGVSNVAPYESRSFLKNMIASLAKQDAIERFIQDLDRSHQEVATDLAKYAVALLRAFPQQAFNIRKWLYEGSVRSTGNAATSTIEFFWQAAHRTEVFRGVHDDQRKVLSLLKQSTTTNHQIGRPELTKKDEHSWRDQWQIILLFFELYTFVLKPMDDEAFFSSSTTDDTHQSRPQSLNVRGVLPLSDIANMTVFLKNMAFTLYWNAAELADSNAFENAGGLSAYFGIHDREPRRGETVSKRQSLAGMEGISQSYLKDMVTGLLRMIHERDSRRNFLPKNHWLMTSHVDMAGFIPAVVAEEEKRHELGEEMGEEEDPWTDIFDAEDDLHAVPIDRPHLNFARPSRSGQARVAEAIERRREFARKKRQLESLAPRLEILRNLPFFIPFETRVQIFREFVKQDQLRRRDGHIDADTWRMHTAMGGRGNGLFSNMQVGQERIAQHRAEVHRDSIFEDAFNTFYPLGEGLKEPIQISFIDKFGNPEAGIDGGGVTKEFLTSITNEAFDPKSELAMFSENEQHEIYPNPTILESTIELLRRMGVVYGTDDFKLNIRQFLQQFEFLGRIMGKCIYEGILVDINFASFFLLKWSLTGGTTAASNESAYRVSINDVKFFDHEFYQGLVALKNYTGDVENDFGLNFSVTDTMTVDLDGQEFKHTVTNDLVRNGSNIPVTRANREVYIDAIARYRLQQQPAFATNAFLQGLGQIIQPMWLAMFNQNELQTLVGGENSELDIADLRRNTQYNGLYQIGDDGLEHPTIVRFWKVLRDLSDGDRRKILKFVTSTPRAPLLGFSNLTPPFTIHSTSAGEGIERLPSTSTCVNLLKLPNYQDETTMKDKLLYAAYSGAGFDLS